MTLRFPTEADRSEVTRMVLAFKDVSPYRTFSSDLKKIDHVVTQFIHSDRIERLLLVAVEDGTIVGMIAGVSSEFLWNTEKHASEMIWWVDPEHRKGTVGNDLREAFEYWAKLIGCTHVHMILLNDPTMDRVEKYYIRKGYVPTERAYLKVL